MKALCSDIVMESHEIYGFLKRDFFKDLVAVPKDYINHWASGQKCEKKECFKDGCVECHVPEQGDYIDMLELKEHFCPEHAYENGYCSLCGDFWGGIESFDFNNPSQLCENCLEQLKDEIGEDDDINGEDGELNC